MEEVVHQLQEAIKYAQINHDLILSEKVKQFQAEFDLFRQEAEKRHEEQLNLVRESARQEHLGIMSAAEAKHKLEKDQLLERIKKLEENMPKKKTAMDIPAHLKQADEDTKSQWEDDTDAYMAFLTAKSFNTEDPFSEYDCKSRPDPGLRPSTNPKCVGCKASTEHIDRMQGKINWYWEFTIESALKIKEMLRVQHEKIVGLEENLHWAVGQICGGKDLLSVRSDLMKERDMALSDATLAKASNRKLKEQMREYIDFAEVKNERDAVRHELNELKSNYTNWKSSEATASNVLQITKFCLQAEKSNVILLQAEKDQVEEELRAAKAEITTWERKFETVDQRLVSSENPAGAADDEFKIRQTTEQEKTDEKAYFAHPSTSAGEAHLALFYLVAMLAAISLAGAFTLKAAPGISSAAYFVGSTIASLAAKVAPHAESMCSENSICRDLFFKR